MIVFIVIILAMIGVFSLRLYKTQAVVTEESLVAADADSMTYQSTVEAARGNILDRNGNVLASSVECRNIAVNPQLVEDVGKTVTALVSMTRRSRLRSGCGCLGCCWMFGCCGRCAFWLF